MLEQNYPNLEYMIVDGASTDQSVSIINQYEKHLSWWVSEKDQGQSDAINKGLRRATGDIVAWLNTDDFYLEGALQRVAEAWRRRPDAPFYFGRCVRVDERRANQGALRPSIQTFYSTAALIYGLNYIPQPSTFIHRVHLETAGYLNTSLHWGLDSELWMRLSAAGDPEPMEDILAASREHGQSKTSTGAFERVEELRRISEQYSGAAMTPGVLCYFLDTLNQLVREHPEVFPDDYAHRRVAFLGQSTSELFAQWGRPIPKGRRYKTDRWRQRGVSQQSVLKLLHVR